MRRGKYGHKADNERKVLERFGVRLEMRKK